MPKAKNNSSRVCDISLDKLRQIEKNLQEARSDASAAIKQMEAAGIDSLTFDGGGMGDRGLDTLVRFFANLGAAIKIESRRRSQ